MEAQEILELETGTKEPIALKPATVDIKDVNVKEVGEKRHKKIVCLVKHPDRNEVIEISSIKYEKNGKLNVSGLFVNLDEDEKIRKGSPLAILMSALASKTPKEMEGKQIGTTEDERGYLCFKVY